MEKHLAHVCYNREDVEGLLVGLGKQLAEAAEADLNVEVAQPGIVYIDEVDKITKKDVVQVVTESYSGIMESFASLSRIDYALQAFYHTKNSAEKRSTSTILASKSSPREETDKAYCNYGNL